MGALPGSAGKGGWIGGHHASVTPASGRFGRARVRIDRKRERRRCANGWPRGRWQVTDCERAPESRHDALHHRLADGLAAVACNERHDTLHDRLAAFARDERPRQSTSFPIAGEFAADRTSQGSDPSGQFTAHRTAQCSDPGGEFTADRAAPCSDPGGQSTADRTTRCGDPSGDGVDRGSDDGPSAAASPGRQEIAKGGTQRERAQPRLARRRWVGPLWPRTANFELVIKLDSAPQGALFADPAHGAQ
jgi:hypothetical protein